MKKQLIIVLVLLLPTFFLKAQTVQIDSLFWVVASGIDAVKGKNGEFTNNSAINSLFEIYGVHYYEQALPFAKTKTLQMVYEIRSTGNIDSLINRLETDYQQYFSGIKKHEYTNIAVYDPVDWQWTAHADDWLWHLKKIEADKAWDITKGDANIKVAVLDADFDITHPELATKIFPTYDPYSGVEFDCSPYHTHGTTVASFVAGETTEIGNISNGQLASVGFNCMMIGYSAWSGNYLERALHASSVMGADILTSSAGGWTSCPDASGIDELVVKEILDNGTTIIMPAGNGDNGTHNQCNSIDPDNHSAFFPLSPYYDERIILVSSTGEDDMHTYTANPSGTHSHYPDVDLCSPGYETMGAVPTNCGANTWPYYGSCSGTSFATPIVAGVASLMYSINPCMSPTLCQNILKNTTDPILDADLYPNGVGSGRVNAYEAVKAAQASYSETLDLFIKDRPEDFGVSGGYHWQASRDESPDIWVRNQADGIENQIHQEPEYNSSSAVYVYVKVRNKSCIDATGEVQLKLYWSKASSWSSWPQNWDGSQPTVGDLIASINITDLSAGQETIYEIEWNILNPYIHENWATCLLARIENSTVDPITIYPNRIDDDVYFNNNIALKNITIVDIIPGTPAPIIGGAKYPFGKFLFVGNPDRGIQTFDIEFTVPENIEGKPITDVAEVEVLFDKAGWLIFEREIKTHDDIKILKDGRIRLLNKRTILENIQFNSFERVPIYVGYSFLSEKIESKNEFYFNVNQLQSKDDILLGAEHFIIKKHEREMFYADAGDDKEISKNETTTITATYISELATYNWYDTEGNLIYTGRDLSVSPEITEKYKLEVIANSDGFKDYDEIVVNVKRFSINSIAPNPATNQVIVNYNIETGSSAYLMVLNSSATISYNYIIDVNQVQTTFNVSNYQQGMYNVVLVCDGVAVDMKSLIVQ